MTGVYVGIEPPGSGAYLVDTGEGDGSTATLTLSRPPVSVASILVIVQGVILPVESYSLNGVTLTFDTAPADGERLEVRHLGVALDIGTPTNATVGRGKIDLSQLFLPVQQVIATTGEVVACTTLIPYDDSIPTATEGDEILTLSITPKHADNILVIEGYASGQTDHATGVAVILFIHQDAGAALKANSSFSVGADTIDTVTVLHRMTAGTTSSTTFALRGGPHVTGEWNINADQAGGRRFGGVGNAWLMVTEYLVTA